MASSGGDSSSDERRERLREQRRRWRENNPERLQASRAKWWAENPERRRELNRLSMRRAAQRRKALEARRAAGRRWYADHREQERARARAFRRDHPDKVREYQRRYKERHPERAAENARRSTQQHRDRHAEAYRERNRQAAAERRRKFPDEQRLRYQQDIERQRKRGREASRLRSRLKKLGLPPRKIQKVYTDERRRNDAAAQEFFSRRRSAAEVRATRKELFSITPGRAASIDARIRMLSAGSFRAAAERLQADLKELRRRDRLLATAAGLYSKALRQVEAGAEGARIREDLRMDAIARQQRGGHPPIDIAAETQRRVHEAAVDRVMRAMSASTDRDPLDEREQLHRLMRASFPLPAGTREGERSQAARRIRPISQETDRSHDR